MNQLKEKLNHLRHKLNGLMPAKGGPRRGPDVQIPAFANDLYRDLRDRRLLPLVGLLLVAIVAVPILLGGSGESEEAEEAVPPIASSSGSKNTSEVVVAESDRGLRDYRKRLGHRQPSNPFKQQYTGVSKSQEEEGSEEGTTLEESSGGTSGGGSPEPSTGGSGGTSTGNATTTGVFYFTYTIDVRVVPVSSNGVPSKAEPYVKRNVSKVTPLPAKSVPALTYIQISPDEEKALMLVNSNVKGLFGEGVCVSGGETCQLLSLEKGMPETVVYGGNERVFRIELLKVNVVETDPPKQAPQPQQAG